MPNKSKKSKKTRARKQSKYYFGASSYQTKVNDLTGAMGPTTTAEWAKMGSMGETTADLSSQPLYYDTSSGKYVTAYDQYSTWNPAMLDKSIAAFGRKRGKKVKRSKRA